MRSNRWIVIFSFMVFFLLAGCDQNKNENFAWARMHQGSALEVNTFSKDEPDIGDKEGQWKRIIVGPWNVSTSIKYPIVKKRVISEVTINAKWRADEIRKFAEYVDDHKEAERRLIIPLLNASMHTAMTEYEKEIGDQDELIASEIEAFIQKKVEEIVFTISMQSSNTNVLEFIGSTVEDIKVTIKLNG